MSDYHKDKAFDFSPSPISSRMLDYSKSPSSSSTTKSQHYTTTNNNNENSFTAPIMYKRTSDYLTQKVVSSPADLERQLHLVDQTSVALLRDQLTQVNKMNQESLRKDTTINNLRNTIRSLMKYKDDSRILSHNVTNLKNSNTLKDAEIGRLKGYIRLGQFAFFTFRI